MLVTSDAARDGLAEVIGAILTAVLLNPVGLVLIGVLLVLAGVGSLLSGFPMKVHRWCGGKGHWGIGPFRRKCPGCSGSGLVKR